MLNQSSPNFENDLKRILNNRTISSVPGTSKNQSLFITMCEEVIPTDCKYRNILENGSQDERNNLFMFIKHLLLTPSIQNLKEEIFSTLSEEKIEELKSIIKDKKTYSVEERDNAKLHVNRNEGVTKIVDLLYKLT